MAELDFVTAPHNIPEEEEQYGWWFSKVPFLLRGKIYSLATRRTKVLMHMTMWSASLVFSRGKNTSCPSHDPSAFSIDTVVKAWQGGSYDGIFAFSQVSTIHHGPH